MEHPPGSGAERRGPAARAAGNMVCLPGVLRDLDRGILRRGAHAELIQIGLGHTDRSGLPEPPDRGSLVGRDVILDNPAGRRGAPVESTDVRLDGKRNAGERPRVFSRLKPSVKLSRLLKGFLAKNLGGRVKLRIDLLYLAKSVLHRRGGGELSGPNAVPGIKNALGQGFILLFSSRNSPHPR